MNTKLLKSIIFRRYYDKKGNNIIVMMLGSNFTFPIALEKMEHEDTTLSEMIPELFKKKGTK